LIHNSEEVIKEIDHYFQRLFPITRSITGAGNRKTLRILQELVPLEIKEYSSGSHVYDWIIPDEWCINDAWIKDENGGKLVDFQESNIHLVSYSEPIHKTMDFSELASKLHTHSVLSNAIPYRTSYYKRDWGFCVTYAQKEILRRAKGKLEVCVDSSFNEKGSLTIGELLIPGESSQEILISTYICHPSLANDNLSGVVMTTFLARELLKASKLKHSYRIIWVPETIGAITYSAMNEAVMKEIKFGFVVTTVGGPGKFGYKQSFNKSCGINLLIEDVFRDRRIDFITYPFDICGSDERQYSTQGFRVNVASITKDKYYEYPYYHTSLDDTSYVKAEYIFETLEIYLDVLNKLNIQDLDKKKSDSFLKNHKPTYKNNYPNCEVMLSKHGLYPNIGGGVLPVTDKLGELDLILWLLFLCDGEHSINKISKLLDVEQDELEKVALMLNSKGILRFE